MMDSFRPLTVAKAALAIEDAAYHRSWIEGGSAGFVPPTS
jgi:homogentisate 1,2-dioxygenase